MRFSHGKVDNPELWTASHPSGEFNGWHRYIDELQEYLNDGFDTENILNTPANTFEIRLSSTFERRSIILIDKLSNLGTIELDLQTAYDVAGMLEAYRQSRIWPARITFEIIAIVRQLLIAGGCLNGGELVEAFSDNKVRQLIGEGQLGQPFKDLPAGWAVNQETLVPALVAFQAFHEIGHLIGSRNHSSRDGIEEELACDGFACDEMLLFCGIKDVSGLYQNSELLTFLSILLWTLAGNVERFADPAWQATFVSEVIARSKAAAARIHRTALHRFNSDLENVTARAYRHFPLLAAVLDIVKALLTAFNDAPHALKSRRCKARKKAQLLWSELCVPSTPTDGSRLYSWERIWAEESKAAERRAQWVADAFEQHRQRPRSRMAWSITPKGWEAALDDGTTRSSPDRRRR